MYRGRTKEILEWQMEAPDENEEFCTMERFRYLTKVRFYIYNLVFDTLRIKQVPQPLINSGAVALYAVCMKYSNVLSLLTFFLNSFHFPFCYKLIVRPESTCLMKVIRYLLALIYRYKSLFFYICKFYVS